MAYITNENIDDILVAAFEGGISSWCNYIEVVDSDFKGGRYASDVITRGGTLKLYTDDDEVLTMTKKDIRKALELYKKEAGHDFDFDNHDSETADYLVQLAVFGTLVYA